MTSSNSGSGADGWGADSEYGVLRDVLLGPPECFYWLPVSAIAQRTFDYKKEAKFDLQLAMAQHAEMVAVYENADVTCHFLEAHEELPYNVFARDSSFMTPFGPVTCLPQQKWRRGDYAPPIRFYHQRGIPIWNMVTAGHFEGGDFAMIEPGAVLVGYGGERSQEAGANQVARWMRAEGWDAYVAPIPAHFVHTDALIVAIAPKLAVACVDALEAPVLDWLSAKGFELVPVSYADCVRLGCNVVSLGDSRILSMAHNQNLNDRLRAMGFEVFAPDMSMFALGGGGVHCLAQSLRRDPG